MPKDHVPYAGSIDARTGNLVSDHLCAQLCGLDVFEGATKRTNGSSHSADNINFAAHSHS